MMGKVASDAKAELGMMKKVASDAKAELKTVKRRSTRAELDLAEIRRQVQKLKAQLTVGPLSIVLRCEIARSLEECLETIKQAEGTI